MIEPEGKKRVQLAHALIDVDFLHKPKMIAFVSRYRHAGVTFMLEFILQCSRATEAIIHHDTVRGFSRMLDIPNFEELLSYCLQHGLIQAVDDYNYTQKRVIEDQEKLAKRRDDDKVRQQRRRDKGRDVTRDITRTPGSVTVGGAPDTDTDTDTDTDHILLDPKDPTPPPNEPPEFWEEANKALVDDSSPVLLESGVFGSTGRKPMKKYPDLWISPVELAEVFKLYQDSGIPLDKFGLAFKPVVARLVTHKANGSRTDKVAAVNWLTSWALDQALTTLKKSKDLERSETYLEQSQRQK